MVEFVWSVNFMVFLLIIGVGWGLYMIFTLDNKSIKFESKSIDINDIE